MLMTRKPGWQAFDGHAISAPPGQAIAPDGHAGPNAGNQAFYFAILERSCPDGEIGRRSGLKIRRPQGRGGSSPPPGTRINPGQILQVSRKLFGDGPVVYVQALLARGNEP